MKKDGRKAASRKTRRRCLLHSPVQSVRGLIPGPKLGAPRAEHYAALALRAPKSLLQTGPRLMRSFLCVALCSTSAGLLPPSFGRPQRPSRGYSRKDAEGVW